MYGKNDPWLSEENDDLAGDFSKLLELQQKATKEKFQTSIMEFLTCVLACQSKHLIGREQSNQVYRNFKA